MSETFNLSAIYCIYIITIQKVLFVETFYKGILLFYAKFKGDRYLIDCAQSSKIFTSQEINLNK